MTWRELWQTTVANLRALFGGRGDVPPYPPASPEAASQSALPKPEFPTVWDDPEPVPAPRGQAPDPTATAEAAGNARIGRAAPDEQAMPVSAQAAPPIVGTTVETVDTLEAEEPEETEEPAPVEHALAPVEPSASPEPREPSQEASLPAVEEPAPESPATTETPTLGMVLESVLFVAGEPVTPAQLARSLKVGEAEVQAELAALAEHYHSSGRGLRLQWLNGKVQLVTAPAVATYVEAFLNLDATSRLSGPALETLAVVAYRQPVTRAQVEAIRGVDCAGVLRSLVQRGLIAEVGRLDSVGRPILYGVTELFMQHFGLADLKDLPPLEESEADRLWAATLLAAPDTDAPPTPSNPTDHP